MGVRVPTTLLLSSTPEQLGLVGGIAFKSCLTLLLSDVLKGSNFSITYCNFMGG